jgi:UDP-N-acetyl-D-glucosamine dehydrogenase
MPEYVVSRVADALNSQSKSVRGSKILIAGVSYKPDVSDVRESPAFDVIDGLHRLGAELSYVDPHVAEFDEAGVRMRSIPLTASFAPFDAVVVITHHKALDYQRMVREAKLIVDTRDALREHSGGSAEIVKL